MHRRAYLVQRICTLHTNFELLIAVSSNNSVLNTHGGEVTEADRSCYYGPSHLEEQKNSRKHAIAYTGLLSRCHKSLESITWQMAERGSSQWDGSLQPAWQMPGGCSYSGMQATTAPSHQL